MEEKLKEAEKIIHDLRALVTTMYGKLLLAQDEIKQMDNKIEKMQKLLSN